MNTGTLLHVAAGGAAHGSVSQVVRDWTITGAAVVAALGAAAAAVIAAKAYGQQAADRHREHASRFSVWITENRGDFAGRPSQFVDVVGRVSNSSDEPMYQVVVVFRDAADPTRTVQTSGPLPVLPPRAHHDVYLEMSASLDADDYLAEAGFDDRAGVRWYRDWQGRLTEQLIHHRDARRG